MLVQCPVALSFPTPSMEMSFNPDCSNCLMSELTALTAKLFQSNGTSVVAANFFQSKGTSLLAQKVKGSLIGFRIAGFH